MQAEECRTRRELRFGWSGKTSAPSTAVLPAHNNATSSREERTHNNGLVGASRIVPALDDGFRPAVLANRAFRQAAAKLRFLVRIALERADGACRALIRLWRTPVSWKAAGL
jgi:hypothetical protein